MIEGREKEDENGSIRIFRNSRIYLYSRWCNELNRRANSLSLSPFYLFGRLWIRWFGEGCELGKIVVRRWPGVPRQTGRSYKKKLAKEGSVGKTGGKRVRQPRAPLVPRKRESWWKEYDSAILWDTKDEKKFVVCAISVFSRLEPKRPIDSLNLAVKFPPKEKNRFVSPSSFFAGNRWSRFDFFERNDRDTNDRVPRAN